MPVAYLGIGSNLGDRIKYIQRALVALSKLPRTKITKISSLYETEPYGKKDQPWFINIVVEILTELSPFELFKKCKSIEKILGRQSRERWMEREIDIDILLYGDVVISTDEIQIPHPDMHNRRFVLIPLGEIAPKAIHPVFKKSISELLIECKDTTKIIHIPEKIDLKNIIEPEVKEAKYIAIEGVIGVGKTSLAKLLGERLNAKIVLEQYYENPFLEKFYQNRERYAFQTQIFFLLSRYRQQMELLQRDLFHEYLITDYIFDKDKIFAHINLKGDELKLYEMLVSLLEKNIPVPDLVIYLQASVERLMYNIRKRGRPFERNISEDYIRELSEAYNEFFFNQYKKSPVLVINVTEIDFVGSGEDFEDLMEKILSPRRAYLEYYNPGKK
ncbi:MAG: 2-amino-4-hydroxy-6-hydroxymethyldihydropteridine diphosphokinase [Candidatus Kryptonium sp.]|nr:2-amino-4-hydroxy-6-hydroxymethyldihydropteridine diphosphokinase [Candidatus Kryptonium sp.]MDW8108418.1 2-amino-4-hydroxy-6-hydroxymethyldihydropteridine diphosphokinase [Candidatus Kryptonium sp.]